MRRPSKKKSKRKYKSGLSASIPELLLCFAMLRVKDKYNFLQMAVDTGANVTTIPIQTAIELGIDPENSMEKEGIATASGLVYAPVVEVPIFGALGMELKNFKVLCHNLPPQSNVKGLLGINFLVHYPPFQTFQNEVRKIGPQFWPRS